MINGTNNTLGALVIRSDWIDIFADNPVVEIILAFSIFLLLILMFLYFKLKLENGT